MPFVGIIGKPNVGKSTFFRALTLQPVDVGNRPFVTISPNVGTAFVRVEDVCFEFGVISNPREGFLKGKYRFVPISIIDVAGLVPGAHQGRGLGNKFLDDLRRAEGLIMVVDSVGATDEEGNFVGIGNYDPTNDISWLQRELDMWFYEVVKRNLEKVVRVARVKRLSMIEELSKVLSGLNVKREHVELAFKELHLHEEFYDFDEELTLNLSRKLRDLSKPMVIAANRVDADPRIAKKNIRNIEKRFNFKVFPCSSQAEIILKELDKKGSISYTPGEGSFKVTGSLNEKEKKALDIIEEKVFSQFGSTGVQNCIDGLIFDVLKYIAVFPGGVDKLRDREGRVLPDCFLLPSGSTVIDLARKIHEDLAKKFVRAIDVRTGKSLGKEYILKHRDVIHIVAGR